ncbi:sel1 repeat family protein [Granulicella arctica]|uniref:Uncharacterized protein n=1 Tax=Granulicella arctica TaxID=940613 RepID=A0A7Y9PET8_9BACT|nr:sel1 repeat family protein [Granulicella arctica]NYF77871.1 hypothetical protein [Granulicella arctica]
MQFDAMPENMIILRRGLLYAVLCCSFLLEAQQPVAIQIGTEQGGLPSSGGYKPSSLSLTQLLESDRLLQEGMMSFMRSGDSKSYRDTVVSAASREDIGAELLLAEQYIPKQCPFEINQDMPHCGKSGNEPPHVVFRQNPLGIEASYEEAARWLEKASAHGSGEASEVLAQLITRMQANGHGTSYTAADSARFHALARSQGYDVEPISAICYKLTPGGTSISLGRLLGLILGQPPQKLFTEEELAALNKAGVSGSLLYGGGSGNGDSVMLMRPEGPVAHVRIILDHDPGHEVLLPIPAHRDVIFLQRGDTFLAFPGNGPNLPRFLSLTPSTTTDPQISLFTQTMDGGHSGGFCTRFP